MVWETMALEAVKGCALTVDSTAFRAYSARDVKRGKSDPDADVGRAGRTYILGYRVHLAYAEGDIPLAYTVQPISRNDKLFYRQLLEDASKAGVRFKVVVADRQYDSEELHKWTMERFGAETAIPTNGRKPKPGRNIAVYVKFRGYGEVAC